MIKTCPICKKKIIDNQSFCFPMEYQYQKCHLKCSLKRKKKEEKPPKIEMKIVAAT
jgi:hypothetical protein